VEHPEVCPGTAIHLAIGQTVTVTGTTVGSTDNFNGAGTTGPGNCNNGSWDGPDLIYGVIPTANGTLTATLVSVYDNPLLHIRTQCPGGKQEQVDCAYLPDPGTVIATGAAIVGTTYYVAADSYSNQSGDFTLTLSLQ